MAFRLFRSLFSKKFDIPYSRVIMRISLVSDITFAHKHLSFCHSRVDSRMSLQLTSFRRVSVCSYLSSSLIDLIQDKVCELSGVYQIIAFARGSQVSRSVGFK